MRQIEEARERGLAMLDGPDSSPIGAVVCASAHLAAFSTVIEPALLRTGSTPADLHDLRDLQTQLGWSLRLLERTTSGEAGASHLDRVLVTEEAVDLLRQLSRLEGSLLDDLDKRLDKKQAEELVVHYLRALHHGPTRPHPTSRHSRLLLRLNAWRDHVLDVMDGRLVPLGRPSRPHVLTGRERRGMTDTRDKG